jgi:hypothetical protein
LGRGLQVCNPSRPSDRRQKKQSKSFNKVVFCLKQEASVHARFGVKHIDSLIVFMFELTAWTKLKTSRMRAKMKK